MTTTTTSGVQPPFFLSPGMTSARGSHAGLSKKEETFRLFLLLKLTV